MTENLDEQVRAQIADVLQVPIDKLTAQADLRADLGLDSLYAMQLAVDLESAFDIHISDEELRGLRTVEDCLELVRSHSRGSGCRAE